MAHPREYGVDERHTARAGTTHGRYRRGLWRMLWRQRSHIDGDRDAIPSRRHGRAHVRLYRYVRHGGRGSSPQLSHRHPPPSPEADTGAAPPPPPAPMPRAINSIDRSTFVPFMEVVVGGSSGRTRKASRTRSPPPPAASARSAPACASIASSTARIRPPRSTLPTLRPCVSWRAPDGQVDRLGACRRCTSRPPQPSQPAVGSTGVPHASTSKTGAAASSCTA